MNSDGVYGRAYGGQQGKRGDFLIPSLGCAFPRGVRQFRCVAMVLLGVLVVVACPVHPEEAGRAIVLSDLSACTPASGLSHDARPDTWRLLPYGADEVSGTMLYASSFTNAPEMTFPLHQTGWYRIRLGIWQPNFAYDGKTAIRVRLSGDPAFRRIHLPASADTQNDTYLREVFYEDAELTGQDLVIGKLNGLVGLNASLAYVKLEPIAGDEVRRIKADRAQTATRNLVATIDGLSYFHYGEYSQPEHVLDQIELYRHSDVAKVLWAVTYGDRTNFPTSVPGAVFLGDHNRSAHAEGSGANDYVRGEQQVHRALRRFADQDALPHALAAKHAHAMGVAFDLMIRLGILGDLGFLDLGGEGFFKTYPHCRQVLADGTVVDKASYAFDEVQDFTIALIREALAGADADGINLCFVRGPHVLQYEEPVLQAFQAQYNEDARNVAPDDPRLAAVRATFMTRYLGKVHAALEEIGAQRGRPVNLSVWVWPGAQGVWLGGTPMEEGLDVKRWIREGWLDSVICQEGIDPEYIALGKEYGCDFVLFTGYRGDKAMSPASVTAAYEQGVNRFAYWDLDAVQIMPDPWNWIRRIGHREEMAHWETYNPKGRLIRLTNVAGIDVDKGLAAAVYSGG